MRRILLLLPASLLLAVIASPIRADDRQVPSVSGEKGFQSLFDGKTLSGWETPDRRYWCVQEGAITGKITRETPCAVNQYLVWTGNADSPLGELADFELKLKSRVNGRAGINNGFQFRSRLLPDHDMAGYQVDNNLGTDWLVRLYDEFGRHTLAFRGEKSAFDEQGKKSVSRIEAAQGPAPFKLEEWHEYHLICVGEKLTLKVNGQLVAEVIDHDSRRQDFQGKLGLQLHSGPETVVQFKDIQLKILKSGVATQPIPLSRPDREREKLLATAMTRWDLGAGGHGGKYPLRQAADFYGVEFDVRAVGTGARPGTRVCLFHGGCFAGPKDFPTDMPDWTYYVRFYLKPGVTRGTLFAKGNITDSPLLVALHPVADQLAVPAQRMEVFIQTRQSLQNNPTKVRLEDDSDEQWTDVIIARSGNRTTSYLRPSGAKKSILVGEVFPLLKNQTSLTIGGILSEKSPQELFEGEIEQVAVWSRGLTSEEISKLSPVEEHPRAPDLRRPRFRRRLGPLAKR